MQTSNRAVQPDGARILIGRTPTEDNKASFGFHRACAAAPSGGGELAYDHGEGHVLAIAPTGAGKGRNLIIPNLLTYEGPVIVIDPKGEAAKVTARHRQEIGQQVVVVDPFHSTDAPRGAINPFDGLDASSMQFEEDCIAMAHTVTGDQRSLADPFWDNLATGFLAGLIAYIAEYSPPGRRNLRQLRTMLCDSDIVMQVAGLLDGPLKDKTGLAVDEFKAFLDHEAEKVRTSVRSTAQQHTALFAGRQVEPTISATTFELDALRRGEPMTIYLVLPPHMLKTYAPLMRIWISTLLAQVTRRTEAPALPTLFVLDELAQLGNFPLLLPAVTLLRGYGVRCMLIMQDLAQLKSTFGADHATIVNNCATLTTFGHFSYEMSQTLAQLMGDVHAEALFSMNPDMTAVRFAGQHTRFLQRVDYLTDPEFAGLYDVNPLAKPRG